DEPEGAARAIERVILDATRGDEEALRRCDRVKAPDRPVVLDLDRALLERAVDDDPIAPPGHPERAVARRDLSPIAGAERERDEPSVVLLHRVEDLGVLAADGHVADRARARDLDGPQRAQRERVDPVAGDGGRLLPGHEDL